MYVCNKVIEQRRRKLFCVGGRGGVGGGWGLKIRGWGKIEANTITVSLTK